MKLERLLSTVFLATTLLAMVGCAAKADEPAASTDDALSEKEPDPVIVAARRDQTVGEESTGYLGVVDETVTSDVGPHVSDINIKRRALYTELATRDGYTVQEVAHVAACLLLRTRIAVGEKYRAEDGTWLLRTADAPTFPSFCQSDP